MASLSDLTNRLQYKSRMDSARTFVSEFRTRGLVAAAIGIGERFGAANRRLIGGIL